ncbi:MAG: hypothetical protein H0X37_15600 [Herpetosiphonaceae bacterium]|nr:hypothetical protein [Herpetosiphonaceae bacterium]
MDQHTMGQADVDGVVRTSNEPLVKEGQHLNPGEVLGPDAMQAYVTGEQTPASTVGHNDDSRKRTYTEQDE